ncbi:MAG TPA: ABC transporter substrate-binding protein [Baekduia sp.]|nr:ABC transporter substrate-binding protein [Baekduia sp.]
MSSLNKAVTRRQALRAGSLGAIGVYLSGCGSSGSASGGGGGGGGGGTLNWLTWSDHYVKGQLDAVKQQTQVQARPNLFSDNADGYLKIRQGGGQFDIVSGDALWVPKYAKDKLIEPFDLADVASSPELYPMAREFDFFKSGSSYLGYPFAWSTIQIYYNPKNVPTAPDSWHSLLDPKYRGKVIAENQPTDLMAMAGLATGAKEPYSMTPDEISRAKDFLKQLKPNILKLASQNSEVVRALADGTAWLAIENLGTDYRVKDAGGPEVRAAYPKEGTYGFIDSEMLVASSGNKDAVLKFLGAAERAKWIAQNFITNGRPLWNEKAYKLLVDQGHKERADRLLYNQPEKAQSMTLKGPSGDEQAYSDAFNEVFGA